jgi:hypothetical protein
MHGRMCPCLLTLFLLILQPAWLGSQSEYLSGRDHTPPAPNQTRLMITPYSPVGLAQDVLPEPVSPRPLPPVAPRRFPVSPGAFGFSQLARAAGMIFSGTVMSIEPRPGDIPGETAGSVAITFRVEIAIRGVRIGDALTISQWIGLWSSGQRYKPGDRLLLFLYPPSKIGFTSCVGGTLGRFPVDPAGNVSLSGLQLAAFRSDPVLGARSQLRINDFVSALRRLGQEMWIR